ncbi:hypothetical protein AMS68_004933 [Peltaster fructicola]|uniref:RTA1 domain protein n=1 Tax=Peltaster fructicola TaxID=286661 RepID=A0A6H0XXK5_9PEZI|nr:hypothetical protein AMS68_004933 [Peltaster fructicola]
MSAFKDCTQISPQCPLEATTYGYYPNLAGNTILCVVFGLCLILQVAFSIRGRTWTWMVCLSCGCLFEVLGYIGRLLMHQNPWDDSANRLQIVTLIIGPSFTAAGIDLTLKHLVLHFGPDASPLPAYLYTWLFIGVDIVSILIQAAGGGLAASGKTNTKLLDAGNKIIIAGIAVQVAQLAALGLMSIYYAVNVRRLGYFNKITASKRLRFFMCMVTIAYVAVLTRCIYRYVVRSFVALAYCYSIPEMASGWGKGLQRNETEFLVLDGGMVALANVALTVAHPTFCFPRMAGRVRRELERSKEAGHESP